ncbi:MAG: hypothetical protein KC455_03320 [Carnobacterium sp.]|nr:hypothetical protein [Carnobacterium sp.]
MEKINIGISLVSLIFVAVNILVTIYMNNKKIKADLVSKTRINWIQDVRKATAELISAYSELAKTEPNDSDEYFNKVVNFQEKNEILILFLGNDSAKDYQINDIEKFVYFVEETSNFIVQKKVKDKKFEKDSNKNKNDVIVFYLRELKKFFDYFNKNHSFNLKDKKLWEEKREYNYHESMNSRIEESATEIESQDLNGNNYKDTIYAYDKEKENFRFFLNYENKLKFFDIPKNIINQLDFLSEIMRIYLKIEWNEAKTNK